LPEKIERIHINNNLKKRRAEIKTFAKRFLYFSEYLEEAW
jgi:hypothetical protein